MKQALKNACIIERRALAPPDFAGLDTDVRSALFEAVSLIHNMRPLNPAHVSNMSVAWSTTFSHKLSEHFCRTNARRVVAIRSLDEATALQTWRIDDINIRSFTNFVAALTDLNHILLGHKTPIRNGGNRTEADLNGSYIQFPSLKNTTHQLDWLRCRINDEADPAAQLLCAISCLPILTNSHLFADGNGRMSRIIFNHLLHRIGLPSNVYLPVYEIMVASQGGFLIRLRQAEIQNDWKPFIFFILNLIQYCNLNSND